MHGLVNYYIYFLPSLALNSQIICLLSLLSFPKIPIHFETLLYGDILKKEIFSLNLRT